MNKLSEDEVMAMAGANIEKYIVAVGAEIGGGFINTHELHVMEYRDAMERQRTVGTSSVRRISKLYNA